ncbi:hypothetical protein JANAI62_12120 [Jannaschia pagri]|uniref:PAS fold-containing protein n=1 Tax=Jannaschia pagri TaxID=2829797 RepID=A0ABQ4NK53_9RHOB|nr:MULTISPECIES: hypothetical protein [unclassified Jannaschia]GIT90757.1 hypothetical protein JANAI61_12150 [Jannaschia sp. AI_61]GIT94589.1 hypothetical protein JANAI62_12120 [Jannaschia sp. AI_62]
MEDRDLNEPDIHQAPRPLSSSERAIRGVARSEDRLGFVTPDGRIATFSARLSTDLGFDDPATLSGLKLDSLWRHKDRPAVACAFAQAQCGQTGRAEVGLDYLSDGLGAASVCFRPDQGGHGVLMKLSWADADRAPHP